MQYILLTDGTIDLYQEIYCGILQRMTDLNGVTTSISDGSVFYMKDPNPTPPSWALPDPVQEVKIEPKNLTRLQFRNSFTQAEKVAIYTASKVNVEVEIWLDDLAQTETIDLNNQQTISNLQLLEAAGLIAKGRAAEILANA
jgi:hypothetical protein